MTCKRYRDEKKITTGTADKTQELREVPVGFVLQVTHLSCADLTTAGKILEVGYLDATNTERPCAARGGTANYHCNASGHLWIEEGEKPYGKLYSPTDSDIFIVSCHGKLWRKDEVEILIASLQPETHVPG